MMVSLDGLLSSPSAGSDQNRGSSILVTETIFVAIATILVLARLYVRSRMPNGLGLDDLFIVFGVVSLHLLPLKLTILKSTKQIFSIAVLVADGLMVHNGIGRHRSYLELSPQQLLQFSQGIMWQYISQILYLFSTMCTRVSICFFLQRIFGTKRAWKNALYGIMTFVVVTNVSAASALLAPCKPVQKLWDPLIPGTCSGPNAEIFVGYYMGGESFLE